MKKAQEDNILIRKTERLETWDNLLFDVKAFRRRIRKITREILKWKEKK